jgi:hypothetical protein
LRRDGQTARPNVSSWCCTSSTASTASASSSRCRYFGGRPHDCVDGVTGIHGKNRNLMSPFFKLNKKKQ